jgi:hypothetical protein
MKLSDLGAAQPEESEGPYPASSLAVPPITLAEALTVDPARDTTLCRLHGGQFTHLNADGKVYGCAKGAMSFSHTKLPNEFSSPCDIRGSDRGGGSPVPQIAPNSLVCQFRIGLFQNQLTN